VLKAIVPKSTLNSAELIRAIEGALNKTGQQGLVEIKKPTRTWKHKVDFFFITQREGFNLVLAFGTNDPIFGYVSRGTKPHMIRPRRAKALRFRGGSIAKTRPGSLLPGKGGATGGFVSSKGVKHPGTKPRRFEEQVARIMQPKLQRNVQDAINRVVKR
jgi:hypothetical protein